MRPDGSSLCAVIMNPRKGLEEGHRHFGVSACPAADRWEPAQELKGLGHRTPEHAGTEGSHRPSSAGSSPGISSV